MLNRKLMATAVAAIGSGLLVAGHADAATLTNQTTGQTLFADGFENGPSQDIDGDGKLIDGNIVGHTSFHTADAGDWSPTLSGTNPARALAYQSFTAGTGNTVTAYTGDQFLRVYDPGANPGGGASGRSEPGTTSSVGDTIVFETAFRMESGISAVKLFEAAGSNLEVVWLNLYASGRIDGVSNVGGSIAGSQMSTTHNSEEWNTLEVVYINGEATATLSVNGSTPETFNVFTRQGNITVMQYQTNADGTEAFFDSVVPEPSSLALIALGGLFIARRRR